MTTTDINSLIDIIMINAPLFRPVGAFATIGRFFQSKFEADYIDLKAKTSAKKLASTLFHMSLTCFSYLAIACVCIELINNLSPTMNLNIYSSIFYISVIGVASLLDVLVIAIVLKMMWKSIFILLDQYVAF